MAESNVTQIDIRVTDTIEHVLKHRFVAEREQLFRLPKARRTASGENDGGDQSFVAHWRLLVGFGRLEWTC
jgi:hypothetical protein